MPVWNKRMAWNDLLAALCLVLIIEGIMPFLNPKAWKATLAKVAMMDDKAIRSVALACMLAGLLGLLWVRA